MKKSILFLGAVFFMASPIFAQGVRLGIRGGLNLADMKYEPIDQTNGTPNANSLASFNVGVVIDGALAPEFSIQTGAYISGKGSKVEFSNASSTYTETINPFYIEIPANLVFKPALGPGTRLYFGFGPYAAFGIAGNANYTGNTPLGTFYGNHALKFGNSSGDDLKATDFGGNFLAGFEFMDGLTIGAQYGLSFTNNAPNGNNNAARILRNKVLSISLGFLFGNK
ncbi:MAG: porin family protein [Chitinophagaceae bacterium]